MSGAEENDSLTRSHTRCPIGLVADDGYLGIRHYMVTDPTTDDGRLQTVPFSTRLVFIKDSCDAVACALFYISHRSPGLHTTHTVRNLSDVHLPIRLHPPVRHQTILWQRIGQH